MRYALESPFFIALLFIIVAITLIIELWKGYHSGQIPAEELGFGIGIFIGDLRSFLEAIFGLILSSMYVAFFHILPSVILVVIGKLLWEDQSGSSSDDILIALDIVKLSIIINFADNFAQLHSLSAQLLDNEYFLRLLLLMLPVYYGAISIAWILSIGINYVVNCNSLVVFTTYTLGFGSFEQ